MVKSLSHIPILSYHKITSHKEFGVNTISPGRFRQQMQYLQEKKFQSITFQDVIHGSIPTKPIIITFDDGYASVYDEAFPVLKKMNFTAVIFIITGFIGKENSWDTSLSSGRFYHLTESQITALVKGGMEIGSHGVSHRALNYLSTKELEFEVNESRQILHQLTHQAILSFAYPFGMQNFSVQQAVRQAGYQYACIHLRGASRHVNPFCIPRLPVYRLDGINSFRWKLGAGPEKRLEMLKLQLFSWPAFLTPLYQKLFKKLY